MLKSAPLTIRSGGRDLAERLCNLLICICSGGRAARWDLHETFEEEAAWVRNAAVARGFLALNPIGFYDAQLLCQWSCES